MFDQARKVYQAELEDIRAQGLGKQERLIASAQSVRVSLNGREVLNFCANNYLGLSNHRAILQAASQALESRGYGLSSVRFICGTQDIHKQLERELSDFVGMEETILYSSCFDANGGLFETLLGEQDAVISDSLNHASVIDGIRLCKAKRHRYEHSNMADLEAKLKAASSARLRMIATDGVFSMDGDIARLDLICDLADRYAALVMVDDSHATGFVGPRGRGTPELFSVTQRVDILSSTLGKALGGASGGFVSARAEIVELLRNRSRPYLFSNTLAPPIVAGTLAALEILRGGADLRGRLERNAQRFRAGMTEAGFTLRPGSHPIIPLMLGDAALATEFASRLLDHDVYVIGFSYPVVPRGEARIRVQISAAHDEADIDRAVVAFTEVGRWTGVLK